MKKKFVFVALPFLLVFSPIDLQADHGGFAHALQASNIMNPNISVIGWFQAEAGHREDGADESSAFDLKEIEVVSARELEN